MAIRGLVFIIGICESLLREPSSRDHPSKENIWRKPRDDIVEFASRDIAEGT